MKTIKDLQRERGFTAILISHDLGVVLESTDRVMVMYAGRIVEDQPSHVMAHGPHHPYTEALLDCYDDPRAEEVRLGGIPGTPPDLSRAEHRVLLHAALPAGRRRMPPAGPRRCTRWRRAGRRVTCGPARQHVEDGGQPMPGVTACPAADRQRRFEGLPRARAGPQDGDGGGRRVLRRRARRGRRPGRGERQRQEHAGQDDHRLGAADLRRRSRSATCRSGGCGRADCASSIAGCRWCSRTPTARSTRCTPSSTR